MTEKWQVTVYGIIDTIICDSEHSADLEADRQDRVHNNKTTVLKIEVDNED